MESFAFQVNSPQEAEELQRLGPHGPAGALREGADPDEHHGYVLFAAQLAAQPPRWAPLRSRRLYTAGCAAAAALADSGVGPAGCAERGDRGAAGP